MVRNIEEKTIKMGTELNSQGKIEEQINPSRDYRNLSDVKDGIRRLTASFTGDQKIDAGMFNLFELALDEDPILTMDMIRGSIEAAEQIIGQDRTSGSSASLFYPIETATRIIALRHKLLKDPLSPKSWDLPTLLTAFGSYSREIIELSGSNTTSLNLPHRAGHILWMIDQIDTIPAYQSLTFLEIGASAGLILDGLKNPSAFLRWMGSNGYQNNYGIKTESVENAVLGVDLVSPSAEWVRAVIPSDSLRDEVSEFVSQFPRSPLLKADATKLNSNSDIMDHFSKNPGIPFIYSCAAFYQMTEDVQHAIRESARMLLKQSGGGYLMITDFAKNMGFPNESFGSASWAENEEGKIVSPKIHTSGQTLTHWEIIPDPD